MSLVQKLRSSAVGVVYRRLRLGLYELRPKTREDRDAEAALRAEIHALPPISVTELEHSQWTRHRQELRDAIGRRDARWFTQWPVITSTMHATNTRYIEVERQELAAAGPRWSSLLGENPSPNHIHQAYHLKRFEKATSTEVGDFNAVAEFGGGYGAMAETLRRFDMTGPHTIFDLPEFNALQRYYLRKRSVRCVSDVDDFAQEARDAPQPRLFIATWSLSESPIELRDRIAAFVDDFDGYLLAYQDAFGGIENEAYFVSLQNRLPNVDWQVIELPHLPPGNRYLFGVR